VKSVESLVIAVARLFPFEAPPAVASYFSRKLEPALLFAAPPMYARFASACLLCPVLPEAFVSLALLDPHLLSPAPTTVAVLLMSVLLLFVLVQLLPFLLIFHRTSRRRRAIESELPFIAMLLYVLSHQSFPNIRDAFAKIGELGKDVFPAFNVESQALNRNLAYGRSSDLQTIENTFASNPSGQFREFIHGYLTTLGSGRDVHEFVREEANRLTSLLEEKWKAFTGMISTMTEVAFIFLAVFPIGMQMIAELSADASTSDMLVLSIFSLAIITIFLLLWMDYAQPALHDRKYSARVTMLAILTMGAGVCLYAERLIDPVETLLLGVVASSAYIGLSHGFFASLRAGETEIAGMLHDLAEDTRSGVTLPVALSHLQEESSRFPSLSGPISAFARMLSLGQSPKSAQKNVVHPSWLVKASFGLLALSVETGSGYEQLERLSLSFRRICDARRSIQSAVLPFAVLGAMVPVISVASYWFLSNMQGFSSLLPGLSFQGGGLSVGVGVSVIATSILTGIIVSKAYSSSFRSLVGIPPILITALISILVFGL
jgi:flagellar protein FlaJ